jgi:hypothetical protein
MSQSEQRLSEFDVRQRSGDLAADYGSGAEPESRMLGFVMFAGTIMILTGLFEVTLGLVAVFFNGYFEATQDPLVTSDYDAWGWLHMFLGSLAIVAGVGLFRGKLWARILGIVFALSCAVVSLGFVSVAPIWSVSVIVLCVISIFAITVHGAELEEW